MKLIMAFPTAAWPAASRTSERWAVAIVLAAISGVALLGLAAPECADAASPGGLAEAFRQIAARAF